MSNIWTSIPIGTIVDGDIIRLALERELITQDFDKDCVRQACYELRASDIFYDLQAPGEDKRVLVGLGNGYLLKPHCYAVSIVKERLRLPSNVLGRILTKGRLFSIGILPINTYADPGFEGRLGITLYNASHRYLLIKPGERIGKIEFTVLPKSVERPYSGQHGYETQIWPIATDLYVRPDNPKAFPKVGSVEEELKISYGPRIAEMSRQLRLYRYGIWVQLLMMAVGFGAVFVLYGHLSFVGSVVIGIMSNLLTPLLVNIVSDKMK